MSVYQVRYTNYSRLHAPVFELLLVRSLATFGGCEAKVMMRPHQRHRLSVARINRVRQGVVSFGMCEVALYVDSSGLIWLGLVPNNPPSTSPAPPTLVDPPRVRQMPPSRQTPNAAARSLRAAKQRGRDILTTRTRKRVVAHGPWRRRSRGSTGHCRCRGPSTIRAENRNLSDRRSFFK